MLSFFEVEILFTHVLSVQVLMVQGEPLKLPSPLKRGSRGITPGNFLQLYFAVGEF